MGVTEAAKFEAWLAETVAPEAYYHTLPENFAPALVVADLSAITVAAFTSKSVITAEDMTSKALRIASDFLTCPLASRTVESVQNRHSLSGCSTVEPRPAISELVEKRYVSPFARLPNSAKLVLTQDDPRYTPVLRSMLSEQRYDKKKLLDPEVLENKRWRVFGTHPLPGDYSTCEPGVEPSKEQKAERSQALSTPCVRRAVFAYLPWSMANRLLTDTVCLACRPETITVDMRRYVSHVRAHGAIKMAMSSAERGDTESHSKHLQRAKSLFMDDGGGDSEATSTTETSCTCNTLNLQTNRSVVIEGVPSVFDVDTYGSFPADKISPEFYKRTQQRIRATQIFSNGQPPEYLPSLAIGEGDLKLVYYILHHSKPGDDVLICNMDSDVTYILLLNAHRFLDPRTKQMDRRIFLDQGHARLAEGRLYRRYISLNTLYQQLDAFARQHWSLPKTGPVPHVVYASVVVASFAYFGNTDYTFGFSGLTAAKRLAVLENDTFMRKLTVMFGHVKLEEVQGGGPVLSVVLSQDYRRMLTLECLIGASNAFGKKLVQEAGDRKRHDYATVRDAIRQSKSKVEIPDWDDIMGTWSRISWALTYMGNAPLNLGVVPSATALSHDLRPLWGWTFAKKSHTVGQGNGRRVLPANWHSIFQEDDRRLASKEPNSNEDPFVPAIDNGVASPGPLVLEQVFIEVKARLKVGPDCFESELKPHWV